MAVAITRLADCGADLDEEDLARLQRAKDLRDDIVHFEVNATDDQLRAAYVDLFEFAHVFHEKELKEELHDYIHESAWQSEAALIEEFRRGFITYQGAGASKDFPSEIVTSQFATTLLIEEKEYPRVRRGDESHVHLEKTGQPVSNCHDCGVLVGQYHTSNCDMEQCPKCKRQLLSCDCDAQYPSE